MSQSHYEPAFGTPTVRFEHAVRLSFHRDKSLEAQGVESLTFFIIWQRDQGFTAANVAEIKGSQPFDRSVNYDQAEQLTHGNLLRNLFPPNFAGEMHRPFEARNTEMARNIVSTVLAVRYDRALDSFCYDRKDYFDNYQLPSSLDDLVPTAQDLKARCEKNAQTGARSYPILDHAAPTEAFGNGTGGDSEAVVKKLIDQIDNDIQVFNHTISSPWDGFAINFLVRNTADGIQLRQVDALFCWQNGTYHVAPIARSAVEQTAVALVEDQSYGQKFDLAVIRLKYRNGDGFALRIDWNEDAVPHVASPHTAPSFVRTEWPL